MRRRRTLIWAGIAGAVAGAAIVLALVHADGGSSPGAASSPAPPPSTAGSQPGASTPVVVPKASAGVAYLSDLHATGKLSEFVIQGPVEIGGSTYPKSISFYCNVGDATPFPVYRISRHARRFRATIGLAAGSPTQFRGAVMLLSGGRTLRTVTVGVRTPKTVDVGVRGLRTLRLECFGSGNSATGGEAVPVVWGNARFSG